VRRSAELRHVPGVQNAELPYRLVGRHILNSDAPAARPKLWLEQKSEEDWGFLDVAIYAFWRLQSPDNSVRLEKILICPG